MDFGSLNNKRHTQYGVLKQAHQWMYLDISNNLSGPTLFNQISTLVLYYRSKQKVVRQKFKPSGLLVTFQAMNFGPFVIIDENILLLSYGKHSMIM